MRIAILDPLVFTRYVHDLARSLADAGHTVRVFSGYPVYDALPETRGYTRDIAFLARSGRIVRRRPRSRLRFLWKALDYLPETTLLRRRLERFAPDVVHVQTFPVPRWDQRWAHRLHDRWPVVYTAHEVWGAEGDVATWKRLLASVDGVVYHHDSVHQAMSALGLVSQQWHEIPHSAFRMDEEDAPVRPKAAPARRTLLFFGRIQHSKGLDVLVRAMPEIARRVPDARLRVVGLPMFGDGEELVALAEQLGVSDNIDWDLRRFEDAELPEMMAAARAVVLPYREVAASGALSMALAYHRPCVVSDVGDLGDKARLHGFGVVTPPDNPALLAAACANVLLDDAKWWKLHERAVYATEAMSWRTATTSHIAVYDAAIAAHARGAGRPTSREVMARRD